MVLSKESEAIREGLGAFLNELAFVNRRWIRIDDCSNNNFKKPDTTGKIVDVDCPLESFSVLLGVSAKKTNEYLCAAKLMMTNNKYQTLGPNLKG